MSEFFLNLWCKTRGFVRRRAPWIVAGLIVLSWFQLRILLYRYALATTGDKQAAAGQSVFMSLGNPISKLTVALLAFFLGLAVVWWVLHYIMPALPRWAKPNFKPAFESLDPKWQLVFFLLPWLSLLFYFGLCFLSASLLV